MAGGDDGSLAWNYEVKEAGIPMVGWEMTHFGPPGRIRILAGREVGFDLSYEIC